MTFYNESVALEDIQEVDVKCFPALLKSLANKMRTTVLGTIESILNAVERIRTDSEAVERIQLNNLRAVGVEEMDHDTKFIALKVLFSYP